MHVEMIISNKGSGVYTVRVGQQLSESVRLLTDKGIGAAVVLDDMGAVCGVLSERDVIHALADEGADVLTRPVRDFMTSDVITCRLRDTINHCMALMTDRRIRHLPVVEEGRLLGIVSIGDVVKWRIAETETEANALRQYIVSG